MTNKSETKIELLKKQVEDAIIGFHPITKKRLSEASELAEPDVTRWLIQILLELSNGASQRNSIDQVKTFKQRKNEIDGNPLNHHSRWKNTDIRDLCHLYEQGYEVSTLAEVFQRTVGAIIGKLKYAGLISDEEANEIYLQTVRPAKTKPSE